MVYDHLKSEVQQMLYDRYPFTTKLNVLKTIILRIFRAKTYKPFEIERATALAHTTFELSKIYDFCQCIFYQIFLEIYKNTL